jgi:hypothetical protein
MCEACTEPFSGSSIAVLDAKRLETKEVDMCPCTDAPLKSHTKRTAGSGLSGLAPQQNLS